MKTFIYATIIAFFSTSSNSTHLRNFNQNHAMIGLDSINPLQIAGLLNGDWTSSLPASIQPYAKQILGQEQSSGFEGILNQDQGLDSGNFNDGGLLDSTSNMQGLERLFQNVYSNDEGENSNHHQGGAENHLNNIGKGHHNHI